MTQGVPPGEAYAAEAAAHDAVVARLQATSTKLSTARVATFLAAAAALGIMLGMLVTMLAGTR